MLGVPCAPVVSSPLLLEHKAILQILFGFIEKKPKLIQPSLQLLIHSVTFPMVGVALIQHHILHFHLMGGL